MNDRIHPQSTEAREPVVTYSRVPSRNAASRKREQALAAFGRMEPQFDAAEVRLIDPHDDVDRGFAMPEPELRADPIHADAGPEKGRRPRSMSVVLLASAFAILAGVGVLAGTIGVATIIPAGTSAESGPVSEPELRLTSGEAFPDPTAKPAVREIPIAAGEEVPAAEAAASIAPPLPRPHPDAEVAGLEPAAVIAPPSAGPAATTMPEPTTAPTVVAPPSGKAVPKVAVLPPPAEPVRPQRGTDPLISSIEETLAKIDQAPAGSATAAAEPLPPPAAVEPPALAFPPSYPPLGNNEECPPPDGAFDPCYDVMPPEPLAGNGYGLPGPVPPASVPYPSAAGIDGDMVVGEAVEPERRPGIVRRAITRTADAVTRVFSRDR